MSCFLLLLIFLIFRIFPYQHFVMGAANLTTESLDARLRSVVEGANGVSLGVSVYDYRSGGGWSFEGDFPLDTRVDRLDDWDGGGSKL